LENHLKSKNGKRDVPLLPALAAELPRDRVGLIFPGNDGAFMREHEIARKWKNFCRDVGFVEEIQTDASTTLHYPITPHMFRHSYTTICYEAGLDYRETAAILGDTPEVVERVYTHLRDEKRVRAAEKLRAYTEAAEA